jgi:hypothetical protein
MKTIQIFILLVFLLVFGKAEAQNDLGKLDDLGRISIVPYVSDQVENLPLVARNNLQSKLAQVVTANGLGDSQNYNTRFIITPNISVLDKYVVPGAPAKVALTLEVAVYVGDGITGKKFGSTAINVKGVGRNETKAYVAAVRQISSGDNKLQNLLRTAKQRILEYYNNECDFILKDAESLVNQNQFENAIFILTSVPTISKDCYNQAIDMAKPLFQKKIDRDCTLLLNKARNAWNAGLDFNAANDAASYLNQIDPNAKCYPDVERLSRDINTRIKKVDDREWQFIFKQQDDRTEVAVNQLQSMKEIALTYGRNQAQNPVYNIRGWW